MHRHAGMPIVNPSGEAPADGSVNDGRRRHHGRRIGKEIWRLKTFRCVKRCHPMWVQSGTCLGQLDFVSRATAGLEMPKRIVSLPLLALAAIAALSIAEARR